MWSLSFVTAAQKFAPVSLHSVRHIHLGFRYECPETLNSIFGATRLSSSIDYCSQYATSRFNHGEGIFCLLNIDNRETAQSLICCVHQLRDTGMVLVLLQISVLTANLNEPAAIDRFGMRVRGVVERFCLSARKICLLFS